MVRNVFDRVRPRCDCGIGVARIGMFAFPGFSQIDFGCIFHTCQILSCVKCSPVCESTKCQVRPRRHSTANVSSAEHVFGLPIAVQSNLSACVWFAAPRMTTKIQQASRTKQTDSNRSSHNEPVLAVTNVCYWPSADIDLCSANVCFQE